MNMHTRRRQYRRKVSKVAAEYFRKAREAEAAAARTRESATEQIYLELARKFREMAAERRSA
jgi:hypothetical protein